MKKEGGAESFRDRGQGTERKKDREDGWACSFGGRPTAGNREDRGLQLPLGEGGGETMIQNVAGSSVDCYLILHTTLTGNVFLILRLLHRTKRKGKGIIHTSKVAYGLKICICFGESGETHPYHLR